MKKLIYIKIKMNKPNIDKSGKESHDIIVKTRLIRNSKILDDLEKKYMSYNVQSHVNRFIATRRESNDKAKFKNSKSYQN